MSLINDALKRARQAQAQAPKPAAAPAFRPAGIARRSDHSDFFMGAIIAVIFLFGASFLWIWANGESNPIKVRARTFAPAAAPVIKANTNAAAVTEPEAFKPIFPIPIPVPHKAVPVVDTITAAVTPIVENITLPATTPVHYKLQSIFYRPKNPSAAINGNTIYIGDLVNGARVSAIEKDYVTLTLPTGEEKILDLP